jgi:hypothetical protein
VGASNEGDSRRELAIELSRRLLEEAQSPNASISTLADMALEIAERLLEHPAQPETEDHLPPCGFKIIRGGRFGSITGSDHLHPKRLRLFRALRRA